MKKTTENLVPDIVNPSPDYYCTWQTQLYATCDGKPKGQRAIICEKGLFDKEKPYGWAYFYENARKDLFLVMDDSWDVPNEDDPDYYGSLILNNEKFPEATDGAKSNAEALKKLTERIEGLGWKGLGGWVCAQESKKFKGDDTPEEYWIKKLKEADESGFAYWKVDWGEKSGSAEFRLMQTELARKYAPNLIIEHAMVSDIIPNSDVFRTYDVPAILSIPVTMQKLADLLRDEQKKESGMGLIDCEDEAYIAAAGGFTMGIMRHPYAGAFTDGREDMSFPSVHRNLKTKIYEVTRAARWHRIAPAFGGDGTAVVSDENVVDTWKIENQDEEFESWWFDYVTWFKESIKDGVITLCAPSKITRGDVEIIAEADKNGRKPYIVASKNPNGAVSVATVGRTYDRTYEIPLCNVCVKAKKPEIVGAFGEYKELVIDTEYKNMSRILIQDLAGDTAYDITEDIAFENGKITVPGELMHAVGTMEQPDGDTSEPGAVIKIFAE